MENLKRWIQPMPEDVRALIEQEGLMQAYLARPPYQRNDYLGWIVGARRPETRARRIGVMVDELRAGHGYMRMAWRPRGLEA